MKKFDLTDEYNRLIKKYGPMDYQEFCEETGISYVTKRNDRIIIQAISEGFFFDGIIIEGSFSDTHKILEALKMKYVEMKMIFKLQQKLRGN